ncbi:MAG: ABC transporter ATP-binding protein [Cytophagaceae bacterium]|jgi:ABC-2 type transport system ATP-binding protein|nr:ABC transporter ATP-binding protein [Cytophagaceae bacterium]
MTLDAPILIEVKNLYKKYRHRTVPAVNGISFHIQKGQILGLLGTNGAGKTTTLSMLCGLVEPDSGEVLYHGKRDMVALLKKLGTVPQDLALYPNLTVAENLRFFGCLHGLSKGDCQQEMDHWLDKFDMSQLRNARIDHLSGGQKRKINLAAALLHKPEFLVLDEPTVGVDIHSRKRILEILQELNASGLTILYTSHYLEEAERLCHSILVMDEGSVVAHGSPEELARQHNVHGSLDDTFFHIIQK